MDKQLFFVINNALVLLLSSIIAFRTFKNRPQELMYLGVAVLFPTIILLTVLGLGVINRLYNYSVTFVLLLLLLPVLVTPLFRLRPRFLLLRQHIRPFLLMVLLLVVGVLGGYAAGRHVFTGTHFGFDDYSYHATAAGHWLKDHSIWSGPFNYHYHNPMNAEILSCWWILPFEQDGFAFLAGLYWLFLTSLSLFVVCGRLGIPLWIRFVIPITAFVSNAVYSQAASTFSGVDLAGPAMVLASLAFLSFRDMDNQKSGLPVTLFSGLACGFAVGCKVPFATIAILLTFWVFLIRPKGHSLPNRLKHSILFGLAVLLTGFFWYGKNIYLTGNPVFPGQLGALAGPLTSDIQHPTKIVSLLTGSGFNLQQLGDLFRQHLHWPVSLGILSLVGYLGSGVWLVFGKHTDKNVAQCALLLLLAGIIMFLTYINMPFSGRFNSPDAPIQLSLRFAIGPFLIGLLLYSVLMNLTGKIRWVFITLYSVAVAVALYELGFLYTYAVTALLVGLAISAAIFKPMSLPKQKTLLCVVSLCIGACCGLSTTFSYQQKRTNSNIFRYKNQAIPSGLSWEQLEVFSAGTTCAALGPNSYQCYPLMGRKLQYNYRVLNEIGMEEERLYKRYQNDPENTTWWPQKPKVISDPQQYIKNASQTGVDCFFIIRYEDGTWPIEPQDFADAGWRCVWENNRIMIWRQSP
jgi:hypothetical protein